MFNKKKVPLDLHNLSKQIFENKKSTPKQIEIPTLQVSNISPMRRIKDMTKIY